MPILDCSALLLAKKAAEPKLLAKAFINHVLPKVTKLDLQKMFLERIAKGESADVPIFTYQTTRLKMDPSTMVPHGEDRFGQPLVKLSSVAYEYNDTMLGGIPVAKGAKGDSLKLLSVILGPNIRVFHAYADHAETNYLVHVTATLYASLCDTPRHWPEIHEKFPTATSVRMLNGAVCWEGVAGRSTIFSEAERKQYWSKEALRITREQMGIPEPKSEHQRLMHSAIEQADGAMKFAYESKCSFCGCLMDDCGGDHIDEMRQWEREE